MELGPGKVAVVTGAGSGIGLALANAFASAGCSVVLADVQEDALAAAAVEVGAHGVETMTVVTDVSKADQVEALAAATVERFGAVHLVCNNAGVGGAGDPWLGPIETWEWVMGVNFWGVVHGIRAFLPHLVMSGGGHIVNTASIAGLYPGFAAAVRRQQARRGRHHGGPLHLHAGSRPADRRELSVPGLGEDGDHGIRAQLAERVGRSSREHTGGRDRFQLREAGDPRGNAARSASPTSLPTRCRAERFWVFPHTDFLEIAVERFHSIGEQLNPSPPEEFPGMPPRSQMMAEVMAAMLEPPAP